MKKDCWCETKNPQGSCCLPTVKAALKRVADAFTARVSKKPEKDCCISANNQGTAFASSHLNPPATTWTRKSERIAIVGSLVSGLFASACCWLPLLLLAGGISGAAVGAMLERYRPIPLAIAFALLGAAFYYEYRPRFKIGGRLPPAKDTCSATTAVCLGRTRGTNWTLQKLKRSMLWTVAVITLAFAFYPNYVGLFFNDGHPGITLAAPDDSDAVFIAIDGMTCKACAKVLQRELAVFPGVRLAEVSYEKKLALLHLSKRSSAPIAEVLSRITNAGYAGAVVSLPSPSTKLTNRNP